MEDVLEGVHVCIMSACSVRLRVLIKNDSMYIVV